MQILKKPLISMPVQPLQNQNLFKKCAFISLYHITPRVKDEEPTEQKWRNHEIMPFFHPNVQQFDTAV